ncbi:MAG: SUMF1/EgtB/PvdO family nonheme iron enzyme [Bacteroidota bacterium]|nr:SUMF1/EgtB/PvdO family nonheme iron enzyme [Bacteroidota bacterium]
MVLFISSCEDDAEDEEISPENPPPGMLWIDGGNFNMGDVWDTGDSVEKPVHNVTLSGFFIGKHEISNAEFISFLNGVGADADGKYNGHKLLDMDDDYCSIKYHDGSFSYSQSEFSEGNNSAVAEVTWYGAIEYCNSLSLENELDPCYTIGDEVTCNFSANGYRLPTEAEWEYAARGGGRSDQQYAGTNSEEEISNYAWTQGNADNKTHNVGTKSPNDLGLYDMSGNVHEWCWDWYGSYNSDDQIDPRGPSDGYYRILRGGSWILNAYECRTAKRFYCFPPDCTDLIGFRIVVGTY